MRRVVLRHDALGFNFFGAVLFWMLKIGLLIAWFSPNAVVRCKIYHKMSYYRNHILTHHDRTQRAAWKTHPCGAVFKLFAWRFPYFFSLKLEEHDVTLTSFAAYVSELASYTLVTPCQIDRWYFSHYVSNWWLGGYQKVGDDPFVISEEAAEIREGGEK